MKEVIRLQTVSQWYLLKQLNDMDLLGKKSIPKEVMKKIYRMLYSKELRREDFIVLCLRKINDTYPDIEEIVNIYPYRLWLSEEIEKIQTVSSNGKGREWYISHAAVRGQNTKITIIYTTKSH